MEIRQLRTFMSIVTLGSFSEASKQLGYTLSSVTSHIQLLEKELGVALFERMGHSLMLTAEGEKLYSYAERITRLDDEVHANIGQQEEPSGVLSLGMAETIATYHLRRILEEYALLYPKVKLRVRLGTGSYFRQLLRENVLDLAFFFEEKIQEKEFKVYDLGHEDIVLAASPTHELVSKATISEKDLSRQSVIVTELNNCYSEVLETSLEEAGVEPLRIMEIGQMQSAIEFACRGLGVALLPAVAVNAAVKTGKLKILPWSGRPWNMHAYMVHHKDKWLNVPIKLFIKLLCERMPEFGGKHVL